MNNPWLDLPLTPPYVLHGDAQSVMEFNRKAKPKHTINLDLLPEPFLGNPLASVVVLALNPGVGLGDAAQHKMESFIKLSRDNLKHCGGHYPFYLLNPAQNGGGREWLEKKLKEPLKDPGREVVAQRILVGHVAMVYAI